ncbi:unnamed protein product [Prorocentrum cordatum]|uniref:RRM domain-containing protein n=1 Tax=Prorocentrum cordatum TaxID=2364126 RepID=A0ABN9R2I8_9DINO|nr:unnamed protein product [Polarella glacialis]
MAAVRAVAGPRAACRGAGAHVHLGFQAPCGPGGWGCGSPCLGGLACESERPTALPLSCCGGAAPDRLTFQSDASERVSCGSVARGALRVEPPGRWTFGSGAGTAELLGGGEDGPSDGEEADADGGPAEDLGVAQHGRRGRGRAPAEGRVGALAAPPPAAPRLPPVIHAPAAAFAATGGAPPPGVPAPREAQAREVAHEWGASQRGRRDDRPQITTVVVRNLHVRTSQQEFLDEVNRSGFADMYDFAYIPRSFEDGSGKGNGFINFKTREAARAFAAAWHRSRRLGMEDETGRVVPLNVSSASLQGLAANLRKWTGARVTRVKNPEFLPFVLRDAEPEPHACVLENPGSAAIDATRPR